jgi:TIR domain
MEAKKKAFISYVAADKEFVRRLAKELNSHGIPIFFDEWDIQPGDSIIQRIFGEGLAASEFFFIVLSKASVRSSWVKDELDVATVRRIEGLTRVVPILKEDCEIPWSLRALRWVDLRTDFDSGVRELTKLVYDAGECPPLGTAPEIIQSLVEGVGGLSREASTVGVLLLQYSDLDNGVIPQISGQEIQRATNLTPQEINDAVDELEENGMVRTIKWLGTAPFDFGVILPTYVCFLHFRSQLPYDPEEDITRVVNTLATLGRCDAVTLKERTQLSVGRLNRAVAYLEDYGLAKIVTHLGTAPYTFAEVSATRQTPQATRVGT